MSAPPLKRPQLDENVKIIVSGELFRIPLSCISKIPSSFFGVALDWNRKNKSNPNQLVIDDRDAELFYHVAEYLRHGCLPRDKKGDCLIDRKLLPELLIEADYFMLPELKCEINVLMPFDVTHLNDTKKLLEKSSTKGKGKKFGEVLFEINEITSLEAMKLQAYQLQCCLQYPNAICSSRLSSELIEGALVLESSTVQSIFSLSVLTKVEVLLYFMSNSNSYTNAEVTSQALEHMIYSTLCPSIGFLSGFCTIELQRLDINTKMDRKTKFSKVNNIDKQPIGCVVLCIPRKLQGGALVIEYHNNEVEYNFNTDIGTCVAYRQDSCTCYLESVTSGLQILLTFNIYENNYYAERLLRDASAVTLKVPNDYHKQADNFQQVLSNIEKFLTHFPSLGYFPKKDYSDGGFTVSALTGSDKLLYDTLTEKGIVISLVHVVCCLEVYFDDSCYSVFKNIVTLLDDRCLLPQHQNLATTCYFIGKRHDGKPFVWSAGIGNKEVDYCHKTITIRTAFVMSFK